MTDRLPVGSTIGILGGGQLGRMLSVAASRLGFTTVIFDPAADCPAAHVSHLHIQAAYDDAQALRQFADLASVVTFEFENIPTSALDLLEGLRPVRPGRNALGVSQDRLTEKRFLADLGLPTAPFAQVDTPDQLRSALSRLGTPAILKTRRFGYDGKGQVLLTDQRQATDALDAIGHTPAILEGFVEFSHEVSVIAARSVDGAFACFDPGQNVHRDGILATTTVPAHLTAEQVDQAVEAARRILDRLDYVGVMGVELFVTSDHMVINEIAPRVHNSGHWTQQGCTVDQFEQHIRAIAGWPLGSTTRYADVVMENLIGADIDRTAAISAEPNAALHLYGKSEVKPGRKMGHVNRVVSPGR